MDFDIQAVGRTNMTQRIDQIKKRIASIEEKIGVTRIGADFQMTLEREIQRQANLTVQPTQGVADVQKLPGTTQPINDNDIVNSAKVAESLRQAEKIETPQPAPVKEKTAGIQPPENLSPEKQTKPQQTPPKIERIEVPDTELTIPTPDEKILRDDYFRGYDFNFPASKWAELYMKIMVAASKRVEVIPMVDDKQFFYKYLSTDNLHPTEEGHSVIAHTIKKYL